jgi:hypothetical protein
MRMASAHVFLQGNKIGFFIVCSHPSPPLTGSWSLSFGFQLFQHQRVQILLVLIGQDRVQQKGGTRREGDPTRDSRSIRAPVKRGMGIPQLPRLIRL